MLKEEKLEDISPFAYEITYIEDNVNDPAGAFGSSIRFSSLGIPFINCITPFSSIYKRSILLTNQE